MDLSRSLSNPSKALKTLISRVSRGKRHRVIRPARASHSDVRGPVRDKTLKHQTRLTYPLRQKVIETYVAGTPVKEIAREFGIHRTTITQIALAAGLSMRNQKLSPASKREAKRLYESGLSLTKVAKQLDISPAGARDAIIETGGTMRSPGTRWSGGTKSHERLHFRPSAR